MGHVDHRTLAVGPPLSLSTITMPLVPSNIVSAWYARSSWGLRVALIVVGPLVSSAFADVVPLPQRLQVGVVEASALLGGIGQVETSTGPLVVDVPFVVAETVVCPCHPGQPESLKVTAQLFEIATEQFEGRSRFAVSSDDVPQASAQASDQSVCGTCLSLGSAHLVPAWTIRFLLRLLLVSAWKTPHVGSIVVSTGSSLNLLSVSSIPIRLLLFSARLADALPSVWGRCQLVEGVQRLWDLASFAGFHTVQLHRT